MRKYFWIVGLLLGLILTFPIVIQGKAQQDQPQGPVYIVKEGDSLWDIALRFGVSLDDLMKINGINNADQLEVNTRLVIPGLEGIQGSLTTMTVPYGETLSSLARRLQEPDRTLIRLNHVTNPTELYAGSTLVIPEVETKTVSSGVYNRALVAPGETLLELAVLNDTNPWSFIETNSLSETSKAIGGSILLYPDNNKPSPVESTSGSAALTSTLPGALPGEISAITLKPLPFVQGRTVELDVVTSDVITLTGSLADRTLHFFPIDPGEIQPASETFTPTRPLPKGYIALQGIHAMIEPGLYPLSLTGVQSDGTKFDFTQMVYIASGNYRFDPVLVVSPETIDPSVTKPEDAQWFALTTPESPVKLWDGLFTSPAPAPYQDCWPSLFGSRRSYNGSAYQYFHTGLDFCGRVGTDILAPADGLVVFAGPLTVRGNATVIDHGWGVYTGYMHQSEILVKPGDHVKAGQVIGKVGGTGRVTGPHLHWEVFVGGVQVDPQEWLQSIFP